MVHHFFNKNYNNILLSNFTELKCVNDHLPYEYLYYKDEIVMKLVFILNVLVLEILYCIAQDICLVFIFVFKKRHVKPLPFDKNTLRYVMCTYFTECKK